jgi:hypothetical protein
LYYDGKFPTITSVNWLQIYLLPRKITKDSYARIFQYKILNNTLYLNKKLHLFGLADSKLCSFCNNNDEDTTHLFATCLRSSSIWHLLQNALNEMLPLPDLNPRHALLGFFDVSTEYPVLVNHLLLIFKIYVYKRRSSGTLSLDDLLTLIRDTAILEINVSDYSPQVNNKYLNKWRPIFPIIFT